MRIELPVKAAPISQWKRNEMLWGDMHPFRSAKPYSEEELSAAFKEWGTPEAGQIYIRQSRNLAPTREDSARVGNVISHYTSKKMGTRLVTASKGVEFRAVVKADFDGYTHEIYCQPKQVKIPMVVKFTSSRGKVIEYLRQIAPDATKLLVASWKAANHVKSVHRSEQRFECFRQAFQQLTRNNEYPALHKLRALVYDEMGIKLGYKESHNFFLRIRELNPSIA